MAPKGTDILSRRQLLGARYGMELTLDELAKLSEVHRATVLKFEQGRTVPTAATARAIRQALEKLGVEFPNLKTVCFPADNKHTAADLGPDTAGGGD